MGVMLPEKGPPLLRRPGLRHLEAGASFAHPSLPVSGATSAFFWFRFFPPFRSSTADWLRPSPAPRPFPAYSGADTSGGVASADVGPPAVSWRRAEALPRPSPPWESRARSAPFSLKRADTERLPQRVRRAQTRREKKGGQMAHARLRQGLGGKMDSAP